MLLVLVILYFMMPGVEVKNEWLLVKWCIGFGLFVLVFRFLNFYRSESRWKLAMEIWLMVIFITFVLWHTGRIHSPLLYLYLLVIITSGLTLGRVSTLILLGVITGIYIYMGIPEYFVSDFSAEQFGVIMSVFAPYILIAYLTTMLSADLHYAKRMFRQLSETDDMTGLENLRSFKAALANEILKANRYQHVFSVLMVDADGLKDINDRLGHDAGNLLIKTVANSIKACLRGSDRLARYGGDEFIILLPETAGKPALEAGERIRQSVENTAVDLQGAEIRTTVSVGIACFPEHATTREDIMNLADRALYQSKSSGRNIVTVYGGEPDTEQ